MAGSAPACLCRGASHVVWCRGKQVPSPSVCCTCLELCPSMVFPATVLIPLRCYLQMPNTTKVEVARKRFKSLLSETEAEAPSQRSFPSGHTVSSWAGTQGSWLVVSEASWAVSPWPVSEVTLSSPCVEFCVRSPCSCLGPTLCLPSRSLQTWKSPRFLIPWGFMMQEGDERLSSSEPSHSLSQGTHESVG